MKYCALKPWTFMGEKGSIPAALLYMFDGRKLETSISMLILFSETIFCDVYTCRLSQL